MRHATRTQRLSRPGDQREALVHGLVKSLLVHGQITTTHARAKETQRLADRLVSLGKDGSIASRRQAFRVLQDRTLVNRLFTTVAPWFVDLSSGYTRVVRVGLRRGDGAQLAVLAFSRLPAAQPATPAPTKAVGPKPPAVPSAPARPKPQPAEEAKKPKGFFEGLRKLWKKEKS